MKAGDRLTIHHLGSAGLICPGIDGVLQSKLHSRQDFIPQIFDPEDGKPIERPFERWIVVDDTGGVSAAWVHEDHLIDPGPPALFDSSEGNATAVRFNQGSEITGADPIRVEINGPVCEERPPEILALDHIFEAAKLLHGAGHERISGDFLHNAQLFARRYSEANDWIRETNAWIESLGEEGGS